MTGSDHIMLYDDDDSAKSTHVLQWPHQWPPWEHLTLVEGLQTGATAIVNETGLRELNDTCREMDTTVEAIYMLTFYTRCAYSDLPDEVSVARDSHVFRAARYTKER